ncbi:MAG TPA: alpha/beta fold hydrolase [Pyrinomonadaceae bacterium]|nr:alpha/beta fold hydrolase [Pyrinomonadaceae bacterium]
MFCFPYAGGAASVYRNWAKHLPSSIEVCPVQLPGRGSRMGEPFFRRIEPLVEAAAEALLPYFDRPFAFFGHSMGAIISFELARLLRREHKLLVTKLFLSARPAPHLPDDEPTTYNLPEPEFREELRRLKGTPQEVLEHPDLMALMSPMLRADFEVCQTYEYVPEPPLKCPITVFGGLQDEEVSREQLDAWRAHTDASFALRMFPGDHFFLHASAPMLLRLIAQEQRNVT